VILDTKDDVFSGCFDYLAYFTDIEFVRMFRARGETDRRFEDASRGLDLLETGIMFGT